MLNPGTDDKVVLGYTDRCPVPGDRLRIVSGRRWPRRRFARAPGRVLSDVSAGRVSVEASGRDARRAREPTRAAEAPTFAAVRNEPVRTTTDVVRTAFAQYMSRQHTCSTPERGGPNAPASGANSRGET